MNLKLSTKLHVYTKTRYCCIMQLVAALFVQKGFRVGCAFSWLDLRLGGMWNWFSCAGQSVVKDSELYCVSSTLEQVLLWLH